MAPIAGSTLLPHRSGDHFKRGPGWLACFRSVCITRPGDRSNGLKEFKVHYGMSQKQVQKTARKMGVKVCAMRKSGETKLVLPGFQWQGSRGLRSSLPQKNRIRVL